MSKEIEEAEWKLETKVTGVSRAQFDHMHTVRRIIRRLCNSTSKYAELAYILSQAKDCGLNPKDVEKSLKVLLISSRIGKIEESERYFLIGP